MNERFRRVLSLSFEKFFFYSGIMNESFVNKVLESIEKYNRNPDTEGLAELYLTLLLAFNLQYHTRFATPNSLSEKSETENLVIKALSLPRDTKYFIEKILILFNREGNANIFRLFSIDILVFINLYISLYLKGKFFVL